MKLFPTMTAYGKWIAISNPGYPDGCELLTQDEFAEQSEHVTLKTVTESGLVLANDGHGSIGQVFTGV